MPVRPLSLEPLGFRRGRSEPRRADGVYCPRCGSYDSIYQLGGAAAKKGLWQCRSCRRKFSVTFPIFSHDSRGRTKAAIIKRRAGAELHILE